MQHLTLSARGEETNEQQKMNQEEHKVITGTQSLQRTEMLGELFSELAVLFTCRRFNSDDILQCSCSLLSIKADSFWMRAVSTENIDVNVIKS